MPNIWQRWMLNPVARKREAPVAQNFDQILQQLPTSRREKIEARADELATLKDLRQAMKKTQEDLAAALHIGQDSVSRLEKRSDMLLSTLRGYVEAMGGKLELVAHFPKPDKPEPKRAYPNIRKTTISFIIQAVSNYSSPKM
jgi:DNA-binding XRE family transcriptional regulator